MTAHWPFRDPAAFEGSEAQTRAFFLDVFGRIQARIDIFANLPLRSLDTLALQRKLDDLGREKTEAPRVCC